MSNKTEIIRNYDRVAGHDNDLDDMNLTKNKKKSEYYQTNKKKYSIFKPSKLVDE